MTEAIAHYLPMAFGLAINPTSIIAMTVLCVAGHAKRNGSLFLMGSVIGVLLTMGVLVLLGDQLHVGTSTRPATWAIVLEFAMALLLLAVAWDNWRKRPKGEDQIKEPTWIKKLSGGSPVDIFGMGAALAVLTGKGPPIMISAAVSMVQAAAGRGATLVDITIFALVGNVFLFIPWLLVVAGGGNVHDVLSRVRDWLYRYNNVIMVVVFGILGVQIFAGALADLTR